MNPTIQKEQIERMLRKCPEVLTPLKALKWAPIGKNALYEAIKNGDIEAYVYKGGYIFTKDALIDYILQTSSLSGKRFTIGGKNHDN